MCWIHKALLQYGGTSAAHVGNAISSAGMGCTGGKALYVWVEDTPTCLHVRPGGDDVVRAQHLSVHLVCQVPNHVRMGQ